MVEISVKELSTDDLFEILNDLTEILHLSVISGASIGFILPYSPSDGKKFWQDTVFPAVSEGRRLLIVALVGKKIVGTVQLNLDMMPNQAHRCEVSKLLVHPDFRRNGIAKKLMMTLEERALALNKSLITLDTRTGDTAEPLYQSLGYEIAGIIPGYCRAVEEARYEPTTYMYKTL